MLNRVLAVCIIFLMLIIAGCTEDMPVASERNDYESRSVTIKDKGNYFDVVIDFTKGLTHRQIGESFARGILQVVPNYEALVDSYIAENVAKYDYTTSFYRVQDIKLYLKKDYIEEIEGMASVFSGGTKNGWKDNKISRDEFFLFNLFPDAVRATQCSFVAVFGPRSSTHNNITGRNLDWYGGAKNQLPKIQAVITMKYPGRKLCSIGYLGFWGIITGFNDSKVFAAIQDSSSGEPYSSLGKRSYVLDLREALECKSTLKEVGEFMKDPTKQYTVNHIIVLSDPDTSAVLENNFSGTGPGGQRVKRELRYADSKLNNRVTWGVSSAVGCVNSFLLYGNHDNHTQNKYNTKRWDNMKKQLIAKGTTVTPDELKEVISYDNGSPGTFSESGDLYNKMTLHMVLFQPDSLSLQVFFHPRNTRSAPDKPVFEKITVFK